MKRTLKAAEVCKQLDLPPYVLRYWETEFPMLQGKGNGAARTFSAEDVAILRRIQQLLYEEGYTIAGAKKKLEGEPTGHAAAAPSLFAESAPAAAQPAGDDPAVAAALDSPPDERIETLRNGIAAALAETRSILELLGKPGR
ncbi:MAG: MerR family transcriptional regulator [Thermoanaerobaculia bacterium]|nr:MerR family transcriptional regulator [Thermoanaerobaculia bacterium]